MTIAKITEIHCSSRKSFDDALKLGIARANKTLRNVRGAWVKSQKVEVTGGKVTDYRLLLKVSFVLKD